MTEKFACPLCLEAYIENRKIRCETCNKLIDLKYTYFVIGPRGYWHADCYLEDNPLPKAKQKNER